MSSSQRTSSATATVTVTEPAAAAAGTAVPAKRRHLRGGAANTVNIASDLSRMPLLKDARLSPGARHTLNKLTEVLLENLVQDARQYTFTVSERRLISDDIVNAVADTRFPEFWIAEADAYRAGVQQAIAAEPALDM